MKTIILSIVGTSTGLGISLLCIIGGLQSPRYFATLATILSTTGVTSAIAGDIATRRLEKLRKSATFDRDQIERAIGAIRERNASKADSLPALIALEEFRSEIYGGEK